MSGERGRRAFLLVLLAAPLLCCFSLDANEPPGPLTYDSGMPDTSPELSPPDNSYMSFPPPDYQEHDYWGPPPDESGNTRPAWPPHVPPSSPGRLPPPPPRPPPSRVPPPPMPPQPPSPPPRPRMPPPAQRLPMRLYAGDNSSGVVQVWDAESGQWGAFCVPQAEFTRDAYEDYELDMDVAKLICQQLGQPFYGAVLRPAWDFIPQEESVNMPAKVVGYATAYLCDNALSAGSPFACEGVATLPRLGRSCNVAGRALDRQQGYSSRERNFVPLGVICRAVGAPRPPARYLSRPPPSPPAPPGGGLLAVNYTMRLTAMKSGLETYPNGSRVTYGRLEVLMTPPGGSEPVWGTVCRGAYVDQEVAQYACRSLGLPWQSAYISFRNRPAYFASLRDKPIHLILMRDCELRPDGLACAIVAGFLDVMDALRNGVVPDTDRSVYRSALELCKPDGRGHEADIFVGCSDAQPPPPAPPAPSPSPPPPLPPLAIRNNVQLNITTYFGSVYAIKFGVPRAGSDEVVWGGLCSETGWDEQYMASIAGAICSQLTDGRRPFGSSFGLDGLDSPEMSFLPPTEQRRNMPVVLTKLDCQGVAGVAPNISVCQAVPADPLPLHPSPACAWTTWNNRLLTCMSTSFMRTPEILAMRLVGGPRPSMGRLEVVMRGRLSQGWGTACGASFNVSHAQAVCRDLGFGWTRAAVLPASAVAVPAPASQPVLLDEVSCWPNSPQYLRGQRDPRPLSFMRDCLRGWNGAQLPACGHESDVVVSCDGEGGLGPDVAPAPPSLEPTPCHGGYGGYGCHGGHGGYGGYGN